MDIELADGVTVFMEKEIRDYCKYEQEEYPSCSLAEELVATDNSNGQSSSVNEVIKVEDDCTEVPGCEDENAPEWLNCSECSDHYFSTTRPDLLLRHRRKLHGLKITEFHCHLCPFTYSQRNSLYRHLKMIHPSNDIVKPRFKDKSMARWCCNKCNYFTNEQSNMKDHTNTHQVQPVLICPHCNMQCKRKHLLEMHIMHKHALQTNISEARAAELPEEQMAGFEAEATDNCETNDGRPSGLLTNEPTIVDAIGQTPAEGRPIKVECQCLESEQISGLNSVQDAVVAPDMNSALLAEADSFIKEAIELAGICGLQYSHLGNGEVLEIYNKLSFCRSFPRSAFSLCPVKCVISGGEARMFCLGRPIVGVATEQLGLKLLIGQLMTSSEHVFCPGADPENINHFEIDSNNRSPKCLYWFRTIKIAVLEQKKQNGDWKLVCKFCKALRFRTLNPSGFSQGQPRSQLAHLNHSKGTPMFLLTRGELVAKYRLLSQEFTKLKENFKRANFRQQRNAAFKVEADETDLGCGDDTSDAVRDVFDDVLSDVNDYAPDEASDEEVTVEAQEEASLAEFGQPIGVPPVTDNKIGSTSIPGDISVAVSATNNVEFVKEEFLPTEEGCCAGTLGEDSSAVLVEHCTIKVDADKEENLDGILSDDDQVADGETATSCIDCKKCFKSLLALVIHRKETHRILNHVCPNCSLWFLSANELVYHLSAVQQSKAVCSRGNICNCCARCFYDDMRCQNHKRKIHSLFECPWCRYACLSQAKLQRHCASCKGRKSEPTRCPLCFLGYRTCRDVDLHLRVAHKDEPRKTKWIKQLKKPQVTKPSVKHKCSECGREFKTLEFFGRHLYMVHKQVQCEKCKVVLPRTRVRQHKLTCTAPAVKLKTCGVCKLTKKHCKCPRKRRNDYKCTQCPVVLHNYKKYRRHMKDTHDTATRCQEPAICPVCGKSTSSLITHMKTHTTVRSFPCRFCSLMFKQASTALQHECIVHTEEARVSGSQIKESVFRRRAGFYRTKFLHDHFACFDCDFVAEDLAEVEEHLKVHFETEGKCKFCDFWVTEATCKGHMKDHIPPVWKCEKCDFVVFGGLSKNHGTCSLEMRLNYGNQFLGFKLKDNLYFKCKLCEFVTMNYVRGGLGLTYHLRRDHNFNVTSQPIFFASKGPISKYATEVRSYKCEKCDFAGKTARCLQQHVSIKHAGKVNCEICKKVLGSVPALKHHMKLIHSNALTDEIVIYKECKVCKIKVKCLSRHMVIHREHKIRCPVCSKGFHDRTSLREHMTFHTGAKNHKCETCEKRFARQSNYLAHLKIHLAVRPYMCEICSKGFNDKRYLMRHLRLSHSTSAN